MFEEKQLLAACTALREDIARHKADIINLDNDVRALGNGEQKEKQCENDSNNDEWEEKCAEEMKKRDELLEEIVCLRNDCCELRAKLELNAVQRPTLLVTRF